MSGEKKGKTASPTPYFAGGALEEREPIDITTHTHSHFEERIQKLEESSHFEERIQKLEERIVCMENHIKHLNEWHVGQERFYGVVRERNLLTGLMRDIESRFDDISDSPEYREYPKKGFQSGYELNNEGK